MREALWVAVIALAAAVLLSDWVAGRISARINGVVSLARRIGQGEWTAQAVRPKRDELSAMEDALNESAERLGSGFAELESRRNELATMLDAMQEAVISISADGHVRWFNSVMQRIAGAQIYAGRPLVHSVRDPELLACVRAALERGEVSTGRATNVFPGRVFEINAVPLPGGGALAVLHDVTGIEAAQKTRRDFVANVSHELRTPLTSIRAAATTLLQGQGLDEASRMDMAAIVDEEASRLSALIGEAVEMAEINANVVQVHLVPQHPRELLEQAIEESRKALANHRVQIVVESPGNPEYADKPAWFDPQLLGRVLRHLLENAARFAPAGSRILLRSSRHEGKLEFSVNDSGPGIDPVDLPLIFEKFYRGKKSSHSGKGTGMGLAIARAIVTAHGGAIEAINLSGGGASFRFWVPLVEKEPAHKN